MLLLLAFLSICLVLSFDGVPAPPEKLEALRVIWKARYESSKRKEPQRRTVVAQVLKQAAGIYAKNATDRNTSPKGSRNINNEHYDLSRTVLVNVVSYPRHEDTALYNQQLQDWKNTTYKHHVQNWLCYINHYAFKAIIYRVENDNNNNSSSSTGQLEGYSHSPHVQVLTYPEELFWSIVLQKKLPLLIGPEKKNEYGDYVGDAPSFQHFGALVMLVPILEVLESGYDVIYFDVDVALLIDPMPFMVRGTADISVSAELRGCHYPSHPVRRPYIDWYRVEPNTGTMHVRSKPHAIALYKTWLQAIVDQNILNDQKVLDFRRFGSSFVSDCNWTKDDRSEVIAIAAGWPTHNSSKNMPDRSTFPSTNTSFCVYNEYLFQNGKIAMRCIVGRGGQGSRASYILGMEMHAVGHSKQIVQSSHQSPSNSKIQTNQSDSVFYSPVAVHANFVVDKAGALDRNGLWLPQSNGKCKSYHLSQTEWGGRINWSKEIRKANKDVLDFVASCNNRVIKYPLTATVYLVQNGTARAFPNSDTFVKMGYLFKDVIALQKVLYRLPEGPQLPDLAVPTTPITGKG